MRWLLLLDTTRGSIMTQQKGKSRVTTVGHVRKEDTKALIVNGADAFPEDSFVGSYWTGGATGSISILEPTFKPGTLHSLATQNNTLMQCIAAMEVNVDGTGHSIDLIEGAAENEQEKKILEDFFKEPYPGQTMISIRRQVRVDLESSGNAYVEVIRNVSDEVVMLNYLDANNMRLLRYDDPVVVPKTLIRAGKDVSVQVRTRERRFVQMVNGKKTYFKEFGASRDVDRISGEWANGKTRLPIDRRGSEIIHFTVTKEPKSPYGVPRWLNQLPSVLGSRKAEEFNLEFFDAGGLPPVLVLVQGGYLGDEVKDNLVAHLSNKGNKHRAVVVEAISSSGSMDSAGSVQVKVERFGAERQSDSMFQNYDKNAEDHVRTAFRLPPMFIGKSQDYNFATAYTAYMVAEAQVFSPEREEFDQAINATVVKSLGIKSYRFRSLPLTLVDVQNQLKAIELVKGEHVSGEEVVSVLNEITGLSLEYEDQAPEKPPVGVIDPKTGLPYDKPTSPPKTQDEIAADEARAAQARQQALEDREAQYAHELALAAAKQKVSKSESSRLGMLADDWLQLIGLARGATTLSQEQETVVKDAVKALQGDDLTIFNDLIAAKSLIAEVDGLGDLCGCAVHLQG